MRSCWGPPARLWILAPRKACFDAGYAVAHRSRRLSARASSGTSELPRRLGATLALLGLVRAGHFIPIINGTQGLLPSDSLLSPAPGGGGLVANVFSLGIAPLMSAYFALSAASLVPPLKRHFAALREQGHKGQEVYLTYVSVLFVLFASAEAVYLAKHWLHALGLGLLGAPVEGLAQASGPAGVASSHVTLPWVVVLLAAGSAICKLASQLIQQSGFGEGASVLISLGVAVNYIYRMAAGPAHLQTIALDPCQGWTRVLLLAVCMGLVAVSLCAQSAQLKLPVVVYRQEQLSLHKKGHETEARTFMMVASSSHNSTDSREPHASAAELGCPSFPFRLCPSGARSLLFSTFWARLLQVPCSWWGITSPFENGLGFAFLVFVTEAVALPDLTSSQLSEYFARTSIGIPGYIPGDDTRAHLAAIRHRLKLLNAAFLASVSLAARAVDNASIALVGSSVDCLSLLLICSAIGATARQVNAMSVTRATATLLDRYRGAST